MKRYCVSWIRETSVSVFVEIDDKIKNEKEIEKIAWEVFYESKTKADDICGIYKKPCVTKIN